MSPDDSGSLPPTRPLAERLRADAALQKSEALNQALLSAIPDLIIQMHRDGTLLACRVGDLAPYRPPSQMLGKKASEVLPAEVAQQAMQFVERALRTGETQVYEHQLMTLTGLRDYEARMVACGENEVLVIMRDITERKRAEKEAMRAERLAALGVLASALAHEINNPLQVLESHLDLMLDFPLEPGESEKYLQIMRYQVERLNAITRRVLNYARPRMIPRKEISLARLVVQVLGFAGKQLQQSGIRVTANFQIVSSVLAAPDQIEQVLLNLVINAIESMPSNGRLHVAVFPEGDQVAVSLSSGGPPIPPDILPHLFEAFYTTKADGTGLGLWISQSIVQQHNGTLTAENLEDGQGVVFKVRLPRAPSPVTADPATPLATLRVPGTGRGG